MNKLVRPAVNIAGALLVVAGIFTFPQDATDFALFFYGVVSGDPIRSFLVFLGLLVIVFANLRHIRGYLGLRNAEDWRETCRSWLQSLKVGAIDLPKQQLPEGLEWLLTCHDLQRHEFSLSIGTEEPNLLQIGFAVGFDDTLSKIANSQEFLDDLMIQLSQLEVIYAGLKLPLETVQIGTRVVLGRDLTRDVLNEKIITVIRAIELYVVLRDRAIRSTN